jgi:hypothetical protein
MDIISHLMERYFTNVTHVAFTDRLLEATMKTIIAQAPKIQRNPKDYDAWAEFMWASTSRTTTCSTLAGSATGPHI